MPRAVPKADFFDNNITRAATVKSWDNQFLGDITAALHDILHHYMTVTSLYYHLVSHVQSSGTGKSHTHDELAKRIFYIPLNLAAKGSTSMLPLSSYYSRFMLDVVYTRGPGACIYVGTEAQPLFSLNSATLLATGYGPILLVNH